MMTDKPSMRILKRTADAVVVLTDCTDDDYYKLAGSALRLLRVSGLHGDRCGVKPLWESMGVEQKVDQRLQDIFELGHVLEPLILRNLERDGWRVDANNADDSKKRLLFPVRGGLVTGTPDAVVMHPEKTKGNLLLCDAKTMNMNRYEAWRKGVPTEPAPILARRRHEELPSAMGREPRKPKTRIVFPGYYLQVSLYAMAMGLNYGMIAGYDKNTSRQGQEMFRTDPELGLAALARAELALTATSVSHVSGCTGRCADCFLAESCMKLKGDGALLKRTFSEHKPLAPGADPFLALTSAFDVVGLDGKKMEPPTESVRKALYTTAWPDELRPRINPELMSVAERDEYETERSIAGSSQDKAPAKEELMGAEVRI